MNWGRIVVGAAALLSTGAYAATAAWRGRRPKLGKAVTTALSGAGVVTGVALMQVGFTVNAALISPAMGDVGLYIIVGGLALFWVSAETVWDSCRGAGSVTAVDGDR